MDEILVNAKSLQVLHGLFAGVLAKALEILDNVKAYEKWKVEKELYAEQKREIPKVFKMTKIQCQQNPSMALYRLTLGPETTLDLFHEHCFCDYFVRTCLADNQGSLCEHLLALNLANRLNDGYVRVKKIEDIDFRPIALSTNFHLKKYNEKKKL